MLHFDKAFVSPGLARSREVCQFVEHLFGDLESRARPIEPCTSGSLPSTISFDCEHPSACHEVLGLELADVDEVEDIVVNFATKRSLAPSR